MTIYMSDRISMNMNCTKTLKPKVIHLMDINCISILRLKMKLIFLIVFGKPNSNKRRFKKEKDNKS